jgi:hypothetical protein
LKHQLGTGSSYRASKTFMSVYEPSCTNLGHITGYRHRLRDLSRTLHLVRDTDSVLKWATDKPNLNNEPVIHFRVLLNAQTLSCVFINCLSQWPRRLRRQSAAAPFRAQRVQISLRAWVLFYCVCFCCAGSGLCNELITTVCVRACMRVCVSDRV